jgi:hypothetical protein
VDPAGDLPFDVSPVTPRWAGQVDGLGLEQADRRFAQGVEAPIAVKRREPVAAGLGAAVEDGSRFRGPTSA